MIEHYRNVVIGSGGSGKFVAWNQAALGERTICVEKGPVGGACPNVACLPSKNIVFSAEVAALSKHAADFGLTTGAVKFDMAGAFRRKKAMIDRLRQMHLDAFEKSGAELLFGTALRRRKDDRSRPARRRHAAPCKATAFSWTSAPAPPFPTCPAWSRPSR